MKKHRRSGRPSANLITTAAEATAERTRMNQELLIAVAHALAASEKVQRKFRNAVLIRLPRIETMLTEVQGAQLVEFWQPGKVTDEQRAKYLQEVEDRISRGSEQLGLKMVRYIYGTSDALDIPRDRRRKWSDWEI